MKENIDLGNIYVLPISRIPKKNRWARIRLVVVLEWHYILGKVVGIGRSAGAFCALLESGVAVVCSRFQCGAFVALGFCPFFRLFWCCVVRMKYGLHCRLRRRACARLAVAMQKWATVLLVALPSAEMVCVLQTGHFSPQGCRAWEKNYWAEK